ncbi:MAG: RNA polymerase sigma factor [Gemmatimonadota bacterium]
MTRHPSEVGPDADLVRRAQAGDEEAFADLVRRIHRKVYRWALARTGDPDDAEDATQRVLIRLHTHLGTYRAQAAFSTWLYRVTANAATSLLAERRRRRLSDEPPAAPSDHESATGPRLAAVYTGRVVGLVAAYFRELPDRQRQIFDLADLQGLTTAEIAERLRMKRVTVRGNLFKARRAIRARILERHPELEEGYDR